MKYSDLKKAIKLLREYGYRRSYELNYVKYWESDYSICSFMVDVFELSMVNMCMTDYLNHLEDKAKRTLEEMDS